MAKAQTQTQTAPTAAQTVAANVAAQTGTTLTQADMVAAANTAHGLGTVHTAYHGGNCACLSKTRTPTVAANMVRAFNSKHPGATVKVTGLLANHTVKQTSANKRYNIYNAIWAGGSLAKIVAVAKANGASYVGLADVVACVWAGWVTLHK
jgi:hypothetical protein